MLSHYTRQFLGCAEAIRSVFRARQDVTETLEWMGIPWRWTFAFRRTSDRASSYLVPLPTGPRWVLTVPVEALDRLTLKQLARPVREAIQGATRVGDQLWLQWDVQTKGQVPEIVALVDVILERETVGSGA